MGAITWGWGSRYMHWGWVFLPKTIPYCSSGVRWVGAGMQDAWVPSSRAAQAPPCGAPGVSARTGRAVVPDAPSPRGTRPGASRTIWLNKRGVYRHQSGFPAVSLVRTNPVLDGGEDTMTLLQQRRPECPRASTQAITLSCRIRPPFCGSPQAQPAVHGSQWDPVPPPRGVPWGQHRGAWGSI